MNLDEPIHMWIGHCSPEELEAATDVCCDLPRCGEVTLVLCLPRELHAADATRALARLGSIADILVVVASDEDRLLGGEPGPSDVCVVAGGTSRARVLIEPDPERAVVGSMQWLRPGDTFCVLWPREQGPSSLRTVIGLGSCWRGAWDEPENGEFHAFPRGPDGSDAHDHQATDDGAESQGDR